MVSNQENWEFDHENKLENMEEEWVEFQALFWSHSDLNNQKQKN